MKISDGVRSAVVLAVAQQEPQSSEIYFASERRWGGMSQISIVRKGKLCNVQCTQARVFAKVSLSR